MGLLDSLLGGRALVGVGASRGGSDARPHLGGEDEPGRFARVGDPAAAGATGTQVQSWLGSGQNQSCWSTHTYLTRRDCN
jgi:uncharacterized protein YidB (DUF937 family)